MNETENKGCLSNFSTFFSLFGASTFTAFICYIIMFQILAEGQSSGYGDLVLIAIALVIAIASFIISSIIFVSSTSIGNGWKKKVLLFQLTICFLALFVSYYLVEFT